MYCKEVRRPMHSILIVDDETSIRMMLFDYLEDKYEIHTAENAEIGLRLCKERRFDLVISDVNMPGMKGPEFLFEVKKIHPATHIILITAYNIDNYVRMARQYNISNIIPKTSPFNFTELDLIVEGLLTGDIFGLSRYLLPGSPRWEVFACAVQRKQNSSGRKLRRF